MDTKKVNVTIQIELNDKELKSLKLTPEAFASSLTTFGWEFSSPGIVILQDTEKEEFVDKIVEDYKWSILETKVVE